MRCTCARTSVLRSFGMLFAGAFLALATLTPAHATPAPTLLDGPAPAALAQGSDAASDPVPEAEPSNVAVESDPFTTDGYLDELLIGSAAAIAVLLLGGFLMRRS